MLIFIICLFFVICHTFRSFDPIGINNYSILPISHLDYFASLCC
jgi:hypothetical protein